MILKNGKIVLEKYFGTFTSDSIHYWASASKSLTAFLTGIAQEDSLLSINDSVTNYLGQGWTSCTAEQENQITIRNLITTTSGLNDNPTGGCENTDTDPACLQYLTTPGTRWAYHTGAYRQMEDVIASASGMTYNQYTFQKIESETGMQGLWFNYVFYSHVRDAARFGLLALNKGVWASDTLLHDTAYFNAMIHTSQNFNKSYGYLWWLNGQTSYMAPGLQVVFPGSLVPNAPADMFAALGKNDQKIYVVPSENMVVVRLGGSAYGVAAAFSPFDDELWGKIDSLSCTATGIPEMKVPSHLSTFPNPAKDYVNIELPGQKFDLRIYDITGKAVFTQNVIAGKVQINCSNWPSGIYFVKVQTEKGSYSRKIIKQ